MDPRASVELKQDAGTSRPAPAAEELLRANTYALLAALLLRPPDPELLALLGGVGDSASGSPSLQEADMTGSWNLLGLAARQADPRAVDDEYHDLFIGITRGELVPYGSWYMTGSLMDKPLVFLRRDLQMLGVEREAGVCEPEDHAGALCEVMAILASHPEEVTHPMQQAFFAAHIEPWLGRLFADMQRAGAACFYKAVGRLGEQFMALERRYLGTAE